MKRTEAGVSSRSWMRRPIPLPVSVKILGLGGLVAVVFAAATLLNMRGVLDSEMHDLAEQRATYMARSLASSIGHEMAVGDFLTVTNLIRQEASHSGDLRYIVVHDRTGRAVAHTFMGGLPADIMQVAPQDWTRPHAPLTLGSAGSVVVEASAPVLNGSAGGVRVGIGDGPLAARITTITNRVLWQLGLCTAFGLGLGTVLASALARPTNRLSLAANRIRSGDFTHRIDATTKDEIGTLSVAFNDMASALEQYRDEVETKDAARVALLGRTISAQEEERRRIALELHDELGQSLSTMLVSIGSCSRGTSHESGRACPHLQGQVRGLIDKVRGLAWQMRPSVLDDFGLDTALSRYATEISDLSELEVDYQHAAPAGATRLPSSTEVCLYRVAQEAVSNVLRHANASQASIVVIRETDACALLVEDDGAGFDVAALSESDGSGLGLMGMRERVGQVGGDLTIQSELGVGTTVRVRISLNGEVTDGDTRSDR